MSVAGVSECGGERTVSPVTTSVLSTSVLSTSVTTSVTRLAHIPSRQVTLTIDISENQCFVKQDTTMKYMINMPPIFNIWILNSIFPDRKFNI